MKNRELSAALIENMHRYYDQMEQVPESKARDVMEFTMSMFMCFHNVIEDMLDRLPDEKKDL